jgi:hypothetical protein
MNKYQWIMLAIIILIVICIRKYNMKNLPKNTDEPAVYPKFSINGAYKNITPLKHDIYKQITIDVLPFLLLKLISSDNLFSIDKFEDSVIGKSLLIGVGYAIYYHLIEPYIINRLYNI